MGKLDAVAVLGLRIALVSILFGSPVSFTLSVSGGLLAISAAILTYSSVKLTPVGVSVLSSAFHMVGQIVAASLILKTPGLFTSYLPVLLFMSIPTGILNGAVALALIKRVPSELTKNTQQKKEK